MKGRLMPTKNFDAPYLDIKGQPVEEVIGKATKPVVVTLADLAMVALQSNLQGDEALQPRERNGNISLAIRIGEGGDREYSTSELATILKRAEKTAGNLGLYRLTELIDGPGAEVPQKAE